MQAVPDQRPAIGRLCLCELGIAARTLRRVLQKDSAAGTSRKILMLSLKREQSDERTRWCPAWAFWDGSKGSMNACCRLSPRCGLGSGSSAVVAAEDGGVLGMEGLLRRMRCQGRMGRTRRTEGPPPRPSPACGGRGGRSGGCPEGGLAACLGFLCPAGRSTPPAAAATRGGAGDRAVACRGHGVFRRRHRVARLERGRSVRPGGQGPPSIPPRDRPPAPPPA